MLTFFRKIYRIVCLLGWFLYMALKSAIARRGKTQEQIALQASQDTARWARGILKILNIRLTVHGEIPDTQGVLIVSNHLGYLDIIIHASLMGVRFAPKKEIRSWPCTWDSPVRSGSTGNPRRSPSRLWRNLKRLCNSEFR